MARLSAALVLVFLLAAPAGAAQMLAPEYVSSEPEDGAMLHKAPEEVRVTFSEPLDGSSKIIVEDHCGNRIDDRDVTISMNEMAVGIAKEPSGHYMVTYSAVGLAGTTGTNNGKFSFMVHSGEACDGGTKHEGHANENEQPGGHGNHPGKNDREHNGHGGGGAGNGNHMGGHETEAGGDHSDGHTATSGAQSSNHSMNNGHGGHQDQVAAARQQRAQRDKRLQAMATGESPFPALAPDSTAILLALALCAAFGGLGGWLLRVSAR